jgi:glycosyltransferase involved in cell wall biosynthesis
LGTAYVHGFKWALAHIDFIFEMDADFSHNQNDLEKLYNACYLGDLAVGSRYVTGSKCGQLAIESCVVVVFCISICKIHHWYEDTRCQQDLFVIKKSIRGNQFRYNTICGLCVSN